MNNLEVMKKITKERPVGSLQNEEVLEFIEEQFTQENCKIMSIPFDCYLWKSEVSTLKVNNKEIVINASPFSKPFKGKCEVIVIRNINELKTFDLYGKIVFLCDDIAKSPLQPKDYPVYFPEEHKQIITLLENKRPKALVAITGKDPLRGIAPFSIFEDGNFNIPSSYLNDNIKQELFKEFQKNNIVELKINSKNCLVKSRQIIATKKGEKSLSKVIISAHMDTKYGTAGALDNATGVAVMLKTLELLKNRYFDFDIDIIPFNSEEYYGYCGEVDYLNYLNKQKDNIRMVINIDSPCHRGSKTSISMYNLDNVISKALTNLMTVHSEIVNGDEWYAGDHCAFVSKGCPCIAVTSSDFFTGGLKHTHTALDTLNTIDCDLITPTAMYLVETLELLQKQEVN